MHWLKSGWTQFEMVFHDGKVITFKALPCIGWGNIKYLDEQGEEVSYQELKSKYGRCEFASSFDGDGQRRFALGDEEKWEKYIENLKQ